MEDSVNLDATRAINETLEELKQKMPRAYHLISFITLTSEKRTFDLEAKLAKQFDDITKLKVELDHAASLVKAKDQALEELRLSFNPQLVEPGPIYEPKKKRDWEKEPRINKEPRESSLYCKVDESWGDFE